jgi:hypothetical protein
MTLSMTRPWKHPDSGYYWFRKRVPDDLRNLIGKREERFSLGTRDPIEAKRLHVLKLAEVEERWSNIRAGQRSLSPDDIARLASEIGDQLRRQLEADPYQPLRWDVEIGARLWTASDTQDVYSRTAKAPMRRTIRCWSLFKKACMTLILETPKSSPGKFW